jgi:hypothetical protein
MAIELQRVLAESPLLEKLGEETRSHLEKQVRWPVGASCSMEIIDHNTQYLLDGGARELSDHVLSR